MKFLFAADKAEYGATEAKVKDAPEAGEPVVPWFPAPVENSFVSCVSFKRTPYAVADDRNVDPDGLLANMVSQYPGLPEAMHRAYIMRIALVAFDLKPGTRYRAMIGPDSAAIQQVDDETNIIQLWSKQPLKGL